MEPIQTVAVATVENRCNTVEELRRVERTELISTIRFHSDYAEGLYGIEDNTHVQILFNFSRSEGYSLVGKRLRGEELGVFACRTPFRPSPIGSTVVELLERHGDCLIVRGLDCLNSTPVLDVKPFTAGFDSALRTEAEEKMLKKNPRRAIEIDLAQNNLKSLLLGAGQIHGHFCGGVSSGVMASVYGLSELAKLQKTAGVDGLENILAIIETNSCFADGVQYAAGCSIGNNGLVYRDFGKTAVTFLVREKETVCAAVRVSARGNRMVMQERYPEFSRLFKEVIVQSNRSTEKVAEFKRLSCAVSFDMLDTPFEEMFHLEINPEVYIPGFAPIKGSKICKKCGESCMETKADEIKDASYCKACSGKSFYQLDGTGIVCIREAE
jgi:formylmethanofuran dehydrogenase subunit E